MYTVDNILPLTIYRDKLDFQITNELIDQSFRIEHNGTMQGDNMYVLEQEDLKGLREEILKHISICAKEVFKYEDYDFYITNSWVNYNQVNSRHTLHCHANSIFSGVFYIKLPERYSSITFERQPFPQISLQPSSYVKSNSQAWDIKVQENDLIIFPSTALHEVKPVCGDRICIAFNTFARGKFGWDGGSNILELR